VPSAASSAVSVQGVKDELPQASSMREITQRRAGQSPSALSTAGKIKLCK
jgi:hypothetical protein